MRTYSSYTDETNALGTNAIADVEAFADGFQIREEMPLAEIVSDVDYAASGRDDHPTQASRVILAFELRTSPTTAGNQVLETSR